MINSNGESISKRSSASFCPPSILYTVVMAANQLLLLIDMVIKWSFQIVNVTRANKTANNARYS